MNQFIQSAFADEIDMCLDVQIEELKKYGINHIEMRGVDGKNIAEVTVEEAHAIKQKLDENGFKLSAIGSPIGKINIKDDFEEQKKLLKHVLEVAKVLDTKYIRMFSFYIDSDEDADQYKDEVIRRWRGYIEIAKGYNVVLLHENEKGIYGDNAKRCLELFETLQCEYVKATFDPANFIQVGQNVKEAFEMLKDHVVYLHIKDAVENGEVVPVGYGIGDVPYVLEQLKLAGYKGFLSLEPHLADFKGFAALEGDSEETLEKRDSKETFKIAVDALNKIIDGIE